MITLEHYERVVNREKRRDLAERQNRISKKHCMKCENFGHGSVEACADCPFLNDLSMVGDEYTVIANKRRAAKKQQLLAEARETRLTTSKYLELRLHSIQDVEICEGVGISKAMFQRWKKAMGLVGRKEEWED